MNTADAGAAVDPVRRLIERWREDPRSTYRTWFLWEERIKNFRSIRRGIAGVVAEIEVEFSATSIREPRSRPSSAPSPSCARSPRAPTTTSSGSRSNRTMARDYDGVAAAI